MIKFLFVFFFKLVRSRTGLIKFLRFDLNHDLKVLGYSLFRQIDDKQCQMNILSSLIQNITQFWIQRLIQNDWNKITDK